MKRLSFILVCSAMVAGANAQTFDFESLAFGGNNNFSLSSGGLTANFAGNTTSVSSTGVPSWGNKSLLPCLFTNNHMVVSFNVLVSGVAFEFGDFNTDSDTMNMVAYDASNNILDSNSVFYPLPSNIASGDISNIAVSTSGAQIDHVEFWGVGGDDGLNNIYVDNFTVRGAAVPEPASMIALGTGALALIRRRRAK